MNLNFSWYISICHMCVSLWDVLFHSLITGELKKKKEAFSHQTDKQPSCELSLILMAAGSKTDKNNQ